MQTNRVVVAATHSDCHQWIEKCHFESAQGLFRNCGILIACKPRNPLYGETICKNIVQANSAAAKDSTDQLAK